VKERAMQVFKWDESLMVRLPETLVEKMGLKDGDEVNVTAADSRTIAISKADQDRDFVQKLRAQRLLTAGGTVSIQVMNEFVNVSRIKLKRQGLLKAAAPAHHEPTQDE
jgi:antitoxin MazE